LPARFSGFHFEPFFLPTGLTLRSAMGVFPSFSPLLLKQLVYFFSPLGKSFESYLLRLRVTSLAFRELLTRVNLGFVFGPLLKGTYLFTFRHSSPNPDDRFPSFFSLLPSGRRIFVFNLFSHVEKVLNLFFLIPP